MANLHLVPDAGSDEKTHLPSYISGYFDGEGCFSVALSPRAKLRAGWEVRPSVSVSQNTDRSEVLWEIQQYFGCGTIRPDRSDQTAQVGSAEQRASRDRGYCLTSGSFHLRSSKQHDVDLFARSANAWLEVTILQPATLIPISDDWRALMNPSGIRKYDNCGDH